MNSYNAGRSRVLFEEKVDVRSPLRGAGTAKPAVQGDVEERKG